VFDSLTPVLQRLAVQGTDLPPTATSLGFAYRYDEESGAMVRETKSLGSVLLDRPRTIGHRVLEVDRLYEHADLTAYNGRDLASQITLQSSITFADGSRVRRRLNFTELEVKTDLVNLLATYGVAERWDVSVLLPIASTALAVAADKLTITQDVGASRQSTLATPSTTDGAAGVGDVLLRSKWQLVTEPIAVGAVLSLRAPTGSAGDFRGLEDWIVEPDLLVGREFGPHEVHATLGVATNADDLTRTRARYGVGGSAQPWKGVALFGDVLGTSAFVEDEFDVVSPNDAFVQSAFIDQFQLGPARHVSGGFQVTERVPRTDVVDLHVGLKWNPVRSGFVFAGALIPLTRDGFRAAVVPTVGGQWVF
jgi:hypothetical protein